MHTDFDCPDLTSHDFSDLLVLHIVVPAQDENLPLFCGEFVQGAFKENRLLFMFEILTRKWCSALKRLNRLVRQIGFGFVLFEVIETGVARDPKHPCLEPALVTKSVTVFQDPEEHVLDQVLCETSASRHTEKEVAKGAVVPIEQDAQFPEVAIPHGQHQHFIRIGHRR
jgi:hypothetical protein